MLCLADIQRGEIDPSSSSPNFLLPALSVHAHLIAPVFDLNDAPSMSRKS